jgi:hypothetical protein
VALCDNLHQGIVPVSESLGNGKDPVRNLYWGAAFGMKSYFINKTDDWELVASPASGDPHILDRALFRHVSEDVYLLAEAYDGEEIKDCIEDFLRATNGQGQTMLIHNSLTLKFGGESDLVAYLGHDGLMEFHADVKYLDWRQREKEVIILACYSKEFFREEIDKAGAIPLLWTTHLMAPEAYTLKAAIDGWLNGVNQRMTPAEYGEQVRERAAQAYHHYQKCGIRGARNLFATGF